MRKALPRGVALWLGALVMALQPLPALCSGEAARATIVADASYDDALIGRIREAKRRIICAFYLFKVTGRKGNLPAAVASELVRARRRGVAVTVILEPDKPVGPENLAVAGYLARNGVTVRIPSGRRTVHAKAVVLDDRYVLIGSHNLTHAALSRNKELSVLLDSPALAGQTARYLDGIR